MGTEECFHYYQVTKQITPDRDNKITLQTLFHAIHTEPGAFIGQISPKPLLMTIALQSSLIDPKQRESLFNTAREPKKLLKLDCGHFDVYQGEVFEKTVPAQIDFLQQYLAQNHKR